jgi:hypothetical protein
MTLSQKRCFNKRITASHFKKSPLFQGAFYMGMACPGKRF